MTPERWQHVKEIFLSALELGSAERADFLDRSCASDPSLKSEVESLIYSHDHADESYQNAAMNVAARMFADEQNDSLTGRQLGHYKIAGRIGQGGMGEVYLAHDMLLDRHVALKLLRAQFTKDVDRLNRFRREARAASALNHPNILTIHEIGEEGALHFIATEYVEGETLRQKMAGARMGVGETLDIAIQVSRALAAAHQAGIAHRDIKPENIMLRTDGYVKVLDFGLAKLAEGRQEHAGSEAPTVPMTDTQPGVVMGTVNYMSPEQARGLVVDTRTDIFSFGVVVYEMFTGKKPFGGATVSDVIASILTREPEPIPPDDRRAPEGLWRVVKKCLEKDRETRYQSAQEVLIDLEAVKRALDSAPDVSINEGNRRRPTAFASRRILAPVGAAITLIIAGVVYASWFRAKPPPTPPEIKSIAVLPLDNLSGDPAQDYFADGITEALIADLAKIGALRVISRTSVMQYKGGRKPLAEIARELNVDAVIEGSVQRSGDRVRITAQLIHAPTDRHLWAESYERDLRDILALQSEVARTIAGEIRVKLNPQEQLRLAVTRQVNPDAYDYYLRGSFYFNRGSEADWKKAIEMVERAVAADPSFAEAWGSLALTYQYGAVNFSPEEKTWQEKAFVAMQKAFSLNPELAEAHIVRGRLLWSHPSHFQHEEAIREYRRALSSNPNSDEALFQIGQVYNHIGLFDKALEEFQKALAINPNNVRARSFQGQTFLYQGRYEDALTVFRNTPRSYNPQLFGYQTAWALFQLGKKNEALTTLDEYLRDYPKDPGGTLGSMQALILAASGERAQAEKKIKVAAEKDRDSVQFHHAAYNIGAAYALMNNPEQAVKWLQTAAEDGFPCFPLFEHDSNLNSLRNDTRFTGFLANLKKQWQNYKTTL